jgi:polysaccharide biosynthesis/export protein
MKFISIHLCTSLLVITFSVGHTRAQERKSDLDQAPRSTTPKDKQLTRSNEQDPAATRPQETVSEEEASLQPYLNNFFATTRLGPEDVISIDVFDQPNYSRANITVPPNGRISYPLIGQVLIAGRTTDDLEKEFTEKLSEYIREPKVSVQLVQVHSMKFMVVGDVGSPGIYDMTRRMTVTEALAKAGYATRYGDLKKVSVLRMQANNQMMNIPINVKDVERGKTQNIYLAPGDTVVVPGNKFKTAEKLMTVATLGYWMSIAVR